MGKGGRGIDVFCLFFFWGVGVSIVHITMNISYRIEQLKTDLGVYED